MTINNVEQFSERLVSLLRYYNKPCDGFVQEAWLGECDKHLTDAEFYEGCILTIRKREFLPPVDEFIKLLKGDSTVLDEFEAVEAWDEIVSLMGISSSGDRRDTDRIMVFMQATAPAPLYALKKLGGLYKLAQLPEKNLEWKRKEFMELCRLYCQVEQMKRDGRGDRAPRILEGAAPQKALHGATVDTIAIDPQNEKEAVPAYGFTSIGDALF